MLALLYRSKNCSAKTPKFEVYDLNFILNSLGGLSGILVHWKKPKISLPEEIHPIACLWWPLSAESLVPPMLMKIPKTKDLWAMQCGAHISTWHG